jgi:digeranylgeranylglycerophospholipid reductase
MQKYEVVIVGAGTAGLMLARELGNQNHKVLILDRKKNLLEFSFNTLGSFIDIEKFGFTENVVAQKIDAITIYSKHVKESVKINGYTLDKRKVHEELIASLNMDFVDVKLGIHIKDIIKVNDQFTSVIDKEGNEYNAKIFVDASGTAAVLSKKIGFMPKNSKLATGIEYNVQYLGNDNEAHLMIGKDYKGGYGWIFPLKNKRAIIGFGTFDESMVKGLKANLHTILELPNIKN